MMINKSDDDKINILVLLFVGCSGLRGAIKRPGEIFGPAGFLLVVAGTGLFRSVLVGIW